jgi:hypothetical protein
MARLLVTISTGVALLVGGLITLAFLLPAEYTFVIPVVIILVVVGVNITAWLVIPRVVGSALPSPSTSVNPPMGGPFVFGRGGFDWSTSESPSDDWSSSWDYAGGDGPDCVDDDDRRFGDDDRWFTPGGTRGGLTTHRATLGSDNDDHQGRQP